MKKASQTIRFTVYVCINRRPLGSQPSCGMRGAGELIQPLQRMVAAADLPVKITPLKCLGECEHGPNLRIAPGEQVFHHVDLNKLVEVVDLLKNLCRDTDSPA